MTFELRIRLTNDEETDFNAAPGDRGFLFASYIVLSFRFLCFLSSSAWRSLRKHL